MSEPAEPGRISARALADLAKAGYTVLRTAQMQVEFEVHHLTDRSGYLRDILKPKGSDSARDSFSESLSTCANGVGLFVGTRIDETAEDNHYRCGQPGAAPVVVQEDPRGTVIFRGAARPSPMFLYESGERFEGLISMSRAAGHVTQLQSAAIRDVLYEVAQAAVDNDEPLLLLQNPVQLPTARTAKRGQHVVTRTEGRPARSSPVAVRFAIALRKRRAASVLALCDRFRKFCSERGYALWVSDSRTGYRQGNWFQICKYGAPDTVGSSPGEPVGACLPITFVGPARVGSTHAILTFMRQFDGVGVTACSVGSLADLAFIHLQLSLPGLTTDLVDGLNQAITRGQITAGGPSGLLPILRGIGRTEGPGQVGSNGRASDYQLLIGPSIALEERPVGGRMPVWFSWQLSGERPQLHEALDSFYRALESLLGPLVAGRVRDSDLGNIDYLVCREVRRSVLRGKARISVPRYLINRYFSSPGLAGSASNFCAALEETWRTLVKRESITALNEVTVSWRESWLGHWTSSL